MKFKDLKRSALNKLKGNFGMAIAVVVVNALILGAVGSTGASLILTGPMSVGAACFFLHIARSEKADIDDLFKGFKDFTGNLVLGLLYTVFVGLWTLLFIIPGVIKGLGWSLIYYIKNDHPDYDYKKAMETSAKWMYGHKWELFKLGLSFIGWYLLSILTLGILLLWVVPYTTATMTEYYEYIKSLNEPTPVEDTFESVEESNEFAF